MITHTMTQGELLHEIKSDYKELILLSDKKDKDVTRIVKKASVFPVRLHSFATTKRKNKWIMFWQANSRKNVGDLSILHFVCYFDTPHGKYAIAPIFVSGKMALTLYPPHFFSRFAERMGLSITGTDLIKRFCEVNYNYAFSYKKETEVGLSAFGSSEEGISLGVVRGDVYLFKTFITYQMCKGEQIDTFYEKNELRKEVHDDLYAMYGWEKLV